PTTGESSARGPESTTPFDPGSAARANPAVESTPQRIGRYQVVSRLGGGAFGDVYLARDEVMNREVAIKVPSARLLATTQARELFIAEARSVAQLRHEAIVRVYDFGQEPDGHCYIVYEYIAGTNLAERIKPERLAAEPLTLEEVAAIVAQVADALHYAHLQGLIHRDIKPANILLDRRAKPLVADFGLAGSAANFPNQRSPP